LLVAQSSDARTGRLAALPGPGGRLAPGGESGEMMELLRMGIPAREGDVARRLRDAQAAPATQRVSQSLPHPQCTFSRSAPRAEGPG